VTQAFGGRHSFANADSYVVNALSALLVGWVIDRYVARRGSANFGY